MAKGNMLLGFAKGKVGSVVFKRVNGDQVTSVKVDPKNPRSQAQMIQRIAFSSAVKTAKALEEIITHSFEGIEYGSKSKNHFVKNAAKVIANNFNEAMDGEHFGTTCAIPLSAVQIGSGDNLVVSSGSLGSAVYSIELLEELGSKIAYLHLPYVGSLSGISALTVGEAAGLFGGDYTRQLTLVFGLHKEVDVSDSVVFQGAEYVVHRLNLVPGVQASDTLFSLVSGEWNINSALIDTTRSSSGIADLLTGLTVSGGHLCINGGNAFGRSVVSYGLIWSAFSDGSWKRSTCILATPVDEESLNDMYNFHAWNDAEELIALANPAAVGTEDRYLNKEKN